MSAGWTHDDNRCNESDGEVYDPASSCPVESEQKQDGQDEGSDLRCVGIEPLNFRSISCLRQSSDPAVSEDSRR